MQIKRISTASSNDHRDFCRTVMKEVERFEKEGLDVEIQYQYSVGEMSHQSRNAAMIIGRKKSEDK